MIQIKVAELTGKIISAQQSALAANIAQAPLLEEKRNPEKRLIELETWNAEKERYELKDVGMGSLAYVVKELMRGFEPPHQIYAACYEHGKRLLLFSTHVD